MNALTRWIALHKLSSFGFLPGFLFWVAFLLVLEPDNVARAIGAGYRLPLDRELLRIMGAASIGGAATPLVVYMTHNYRIEGTQHWRNALLHMLTMAGLAAALIIVSCFAAAWAFGHQWVPSINDVRDELISNWTLLLFALTCLTAIAHLTCRQTLSVPEASPVAAQPMNRVLVTNRGCRKWIAIDDVDWIESQGNYVTMHVGGRTHWVRQTLSAFEAQLDGKRFARIHRRTIVALDRIREIVAEGNGDASIKLKDGSTLRASRKYRQFLQDRWLGFGGTTGLQ